MRFGALVAARLASAVRDAPVALWAPVTDPRRFLEEAVRARASGALVTDEAALAAGAAPRVDVFDAPLAAELIDGAVVGSLADELGEQPRDVLVVQTAAEPGSADRYRALIERCRARHLRVEAASLPRERARDGAPVPSEDAGPLVDYTAGWLALRLLAPPARTANGNGGT